MLKAQDDVQEHGTHDGDMCEYDADQTKSWGKERGEVDIDPDVFSWCSESERTDKIDHDELSAEDDSESEMEWESPMAAKHFTGFHCNIDGYKTHGVDVNACFELMDKPPDIVFLNETKMRPQELEIQIACYESLCQRGRPNTGGGGIAVFGKKDVIGRMTFVFASEEFERCWFLLHTDEGPVLLCCWYRPPGEIIAGIRSFADELRKFRIQAVAVMVIGDLNVHNKQWLKYSSGTTPEGCELQDIVHVGAATTRVASNLGGVIFSQCGFPRTSKNVCTCV